MLPGPFKVRLPEVYQIEASSACDHSCTMCPRAYYHREDKKAIFEIELLKTMISRGDLEGSYFIELQMSGEPLLNPKIYHIINLLKDEGIIVGLSTHGDLFPMYFDVCDHLDYITISVDSITRRNEIRKGSKYGNATAYLEHLYNVVKYFIQRKIPIDLQFIELKGWESEKDLLEIFLWEKLLHFPNKELLTIRSIPDCCILHRTGNRLKKEEDKGICLNPWLSVSVQSNGNVSPCCFAWGDEIIYGNLYNSSLEEIWNGEEVERIKQKHQRGFIHLPDLCMRCYQRSPTLLHWELYLNSVVSANRQHRFLQRPNKK